MFSIGLGRLGLIVAAFVLQTALLRAALPAPDEPPAVASLAGQLLVAAPLMGDPRFAHTVILIVEHSPSGALGLVINKPIGEQPLANVLKALGQKDAEVAGNVRIFSGGPVRREVGFVVHSPDYHRPETVAITGRLSIHKYTGRPPAACIISEQRWRPHVAKASMPQFRPAEAFSSFAIPRDLSDAAWSG